MRLAAILRLRCPHCLEGQVFSGLLAMYETCPNCGIEYEREHGFFMMSIFFGYVLGFLVALPVTVFLYMLQAPLYWYPIGLALALIPLSPLIFRYARVLWMHFDELLDPRPDQPASPPPTP
jgi:uncharacterized protein (DUF983 family)